MRRASEQHPSAGVPSSVRSHVLQCSCVGGAAAHRGGACGCGDRRAPSIVNDVIRSAGQALDTETRASMESRFGRSFGDVRVHADARAAESARAVHAAAYTVGRHVVFGPDRYRPGTASGNRLLAHELTHVVQQRFAPEAASDLRIGAAHDPGEREAQRAAATLEPPRGSIVDGGVAVLQRQAANGPMGPPAVCGPDATEWLVRQIATAKGDRDVLAIQEDLARAQRVAASYGFSAERVAEGGVAKQVAAEAERAGSPSPTPNASSQFAQSVRGQREFGRALIAATVPFVGMPEQIVLLSIRRAALAWKGLVGTNRRYDFKNDPRTMSAPAVNGCPLGCPGTITLCAGNGLACYGTDVPGNLFYAHVGRFVGWTELSLQLGSQFAQLDSTHRWDPPEDTSMITAGFGIANAATRPDVCSAAAGLTARACSPCSIPTSAAIR